MHILIKILTFILNFIYFFIKILPTKEKVVMISRQANEPSRDFKLLKEALNKSNPNIEVRFLCRTLDGGLNSSFVNKIKYAFHMLDVYKRQELNVSTSMQAFQQRKNSFTDYQEILQKLENKHLGYINKHEMRISKQYQLSLIHI